MPNETATNDDVLKQFVHGYNGRALICDVGPNSGKYRVTVTAYLTPAEYERLELLKYGTESLSNN